MYENDYFNQIIRDYNDGPDSVIRCPECRSTDVFTAKKKTPRGIEKVYICRGCWTKGDIIEFSN